MSHLTLETLARLVDETPTADEAAHLEACERCRSELEDMRADAAALAALPPIEPPPGQWAAIESRLMAEGVLRGARHRFSWSGALLRMAAAIVLFVLGGLAGASWANGRGARPQIAASDLPAATARPPVQVRSSDPVQTARSPEAEPEPREQRTPRSEPEERGRPVVQAPPTLAAFLAGNEPDSYEEAVALYRETEELYLDALTRMAELGDGEVVGDPYARLAALQAITSITRTALGQAPADPVINGYHVTALAQRDATLRQIAATTTDSWF